MRPRPFPNRAVLTIGFVIGLVATFLVADMTAVNAAQIISGNNSSVRVEVTKGTLVKLREPADTVFVADPEICDIQVKSPRLVYLMGKKPGQTTLFAVGAGDQVPRQHRCHGDPQSDTPQFRDKEALS